MANALYGKGKEKFLGNTSAISLDIDTVKASLVTSAYVPNLAIDEWYTSISAYVIGTTQTLATKTITLGVFDALDITFPLVTAGSIAKYVVLWKDTTVAGTSPLIACLDTITGFPLTTNGGDVTVQWDNGAYKIFSL
jgi:hypothetical protein